MNPRDAAATRITDLQIAEAFRDLIDPALCDEACDYYRPDGEPACTDLLDSDTCDPCKARLAFELAERRAT